jgi:hypothetical protein
MSVGAVDHELRHELTEEIDGLDDLACVEGVVDGVARPGCRDDVALAQDGQVLDLISDAPMLRQWFWG